MASRPSRSHLLDPKSPLLTSVDLAGDAFVLPPDQLMSSSAAWVSSPGRSPRESPRGTPIKDPSANPVLIMKFGGSSLLGAEHLTRVAGIVRKALPDRPIVVLSAMGKTTNNLLAAANLALESSKVDMEAIRKTHETVLSELGIPVPASVSSLLDELERILNGVALLKEVSMQTRDRIVSFGERLAVRTFAAVFNFNKANPQEIEARSFDSWEIGMKTTSGSGSANSAFSQVEVLPESYAEIGHFFRPLVRDFTYVPIVTGYIAHDLQGVITTLGRDGSDLSAAIIGAAMKATEVQIWKDVSGIQTIDPRVSPAAKPIGVLTFEEAAELSTFGAKVVHPAAVLPCWIAGVPMSVRNSMDPELPGTRIVPKLSPMDSRDGKVAAISSKSDITVVVIKSSRMLGQHGFLAHVFSVFNKFEASIDVIATSEVTISLTLDQGYKSIDLAGIKSALDSAARVDIMQDMAMLTLITAKKDSVDVMKDTFIAFSEIGLPVEMVSHGASNVNVTFVIPGNRLLEASRTLHEVFFER